MKRTFLAAAVVITFGFAAVAQSGKKPASSHHLAGNPDAALPEFTGAARPPALCNPCLFYGGDLNPNDSNAVGFADENTLSVIGGSGTYGEVDIPSGITVTVKGILFNLQADAAFDPFTASYDIRTGVSEGDGGTSIASGTTTIQVVSTGRNFLGVAEYSAVVVFPPIRLPSGAYWINLTPNCLNTLDGSCSVFGFYVSNTTSRTNALHPYWQPGHEIFVNSGYFDFTWANWCDPDTGLNQTQCALVSFGLLGGVE